MSDGLTKIEVTRTYMKTTTISVPRRGRSNDQLLSDYESEIEDGLAAASLTGGEDFHEVHDPIGEPVVIQESNVIGYAIRVRENGKMIGKDPEGYPNCVDEWASYLRPWKTAQAAHDEIRGISHWNLYNLGAVSDFTYEAVPLTIGA